MSYLFPLQNYRPLLDMSETEQGIKVIKEFFADNLSTALRLRRVTAPLFVLRGLGINDVESTSKCKITIFFCRTHFWVFQN